MFKNLFFWLLITLLFSQCSEDIKPTDAAIGREYYPVKVGNYWIYDVVETRVSNNKYDSLKYQIRELIDTVYRNAANEITYRVKYSRKKNSDPDWTNDSLLMLNKSLSDVRRTQNNFKTISLIFPVQEGKQWKPNAFNTRDVEDYYYTGVNQPFVLNNVTYDSTITVVQGEPDLTVLDDRKEVYAYKTGLIYKNHTVYEYAQIAPGNIPDPTRVAKGFKRVLKLKSFYSAE
jgi:hypothetical protein